MAQLNALITTSIIALLIMPLALATCAEDQETISAFYEASKEENYQSYIALMDTEYIYDYLADEQAYKDYVTAAWEVYDTKDYSLAFLKCNELPTGSVTFFKAITTITSEGKEYNLERIMVAIMEQGKIQFVMDEQTFSFHQGAAYAVMYYNHTKDLVEEELQAAAKIAAYAEQEGTKKKTWWPYLILILIAALIYHERERIKKAASKGTPHATKAIARAKKQAKKLSETAKQQGRAAIAKSKEGYKQHVKPHMKRLAGKQQPNKKPKTKK